MFLKIDCREVELMKRIHAFKEVFNLQHIVVKSENLPLGDLIVCDDDGAEKIIIERKSLQDLAASIRDGRYTEQGFRLNGSPIHNHNIIYMIEGDLRYYKPFRTNIDKRALLSAMVSINYYKGFSIQRCINLDESAEFVLHLVAKVEKESKTAKSKSYYEGGAGQLESVTYTSVTKKVKKDNITVENIGELMLCQVPGVSAAVAMAVMKKFGTISTLLKNLETNEKCLDDITITTKNGQNRRISKSSICNIYQYVLNKNSLVLCADTDALDTGALDTGALDTGALDTGALDTGALDAGALDAGALDAGALDAHANPPTDAEETVMV